MAKRIWLFALSTLLFQNKTCNPIPLAMEFNGSSKKVTPLIEFSFD